MKIIITESQMKGLVNHTRKTEIKEDFEENNLIERIITLENSIAKQQRLIGNTKTLFQSLP
jgi:hypothetical protein